MDDVVLASDVLSNKLRVVAGHDLMRNVRTPQCVLHPPVDVLDGVDDDESPA